MRIATSDTNHAQNLQNGRSRMEKSVDLMRDLDGTNMLVNKNLVLMLMLYIIDHWVKNHFIQ